MRGSSSLIISLLICFSYAIHELYVGCLFVYSISKNAELPPLARML